MRTRVQGGEVVGHAITLKTTDGSKHIKINYGDDNGGITGTGAAVYSLSDSRKFKSIVELVSYFNYNSLKESFSGNNFCIIYIYNTNKTNIPPTLFKGMIL